MTTQADLDWWLATAPTLEWIWAKTYADTAPHWYLPRERTRLSLDDYHRALKVIWTFGTPRKFYRRTNLELVDPATNRKWFDTSHRLEDSLINMAQADHLYGEQDAPDTSAPFSYYDKLAADYDARYTDPESLAENTWVWRLVTEAPLPSTATGYPDILDVGAGTGLALDLRLVPHDRPDLYRAVDPSQGMLNEMVIKHPWVRDLHPLTFEDYYRDHDGRTFDTVISLFGSPSYIDPEMIPLLPTLSTRQCILMHYVEGYVPSYEVADGFDPRAHDASRLAASALLREYPGTCHLLNNFQVTVLRTN